MRVKVKEKVLVLLACTLTSFSFSGSQGFVFGVGQMPKVNLTPMDPVVCISQNITFRCSVSHKSHFKSPIGFLKGKEFPLSVEKNYNKISENIAELILKNVSEADRNLAICCTLGNDKCEAGPSILNVYHSVNKSYMGTISPLDPDVCTTQNITFTCTLQDPPELNYSIGFAIKNESTNREYVAVESRQITVVNETVSELTIYKINVTTSFDIFVRCYYWQVFGDLDASLQLGETTTASVLTMPKKIEEINCVVENYYKTMNCTWDYGIKYEVMPKVSFQWRIPNFSASWNDCQDLNKKYGFCYWNSTLRGDFSLKIVQIRITLEEDCGVKIPSNFTVDTRKIVKPDPVISLKSTVLNSTCIEVSWQTNQSEQQYPKEHRVVLSSKWGDDRELKFNTTTDTEGSTHIRTLCGLYPYTEYTFRVSIQPTRDQAGFYSNPKMTVAKTYSDIPSSSPEVTDGGYSWYPRNCEENNRRRRVCVFWKPIRMEEKNGPMKGLKGIFMPDNMVKTPIEEDWAEDLTYGCSYELQCNESYRFTVKARNVNGTSKFGSELKISAATSGIRQPDFVVESANGSEVYVSWKYQEEVSTERFMVVWCRNKNGDCENNHEVHWQYFPPLSREAILRINSSNSAQDFLYGVSAITPYGSSGVEWQDCVYLKNKVPRREPKNVVVSEGSEDNTLVVTWDKLTCKSDEPYIAMYNLQFNKLNDASKKSENVTASGEARLVLNGLEEDQTYVVTVRAITKDGHYGPESQPKTGVPVNKSLKSGAIIGIVMAVLFVVILAGVGCFCIMRKCKRKAQMKYKNVTKITIPGNNNNGPFDDETIDSTIDRVSTKSIERQNSDDSGIDPMTPQHDKLVDPPKFKDKITLRPDDYVIVASDKDRHEDDPGNTPFHSTVPAQTQTHILPGQRDCTVGMVRQKIEQFPNGVRKVGNDETSVKARQKNESGDSGVSDTYSKVTLDRSRADDVDDADENIPYSLSNNETPQYKADNSYEKKMSQNKSKIDGIIPKPMAFSEHSESECSFSDRENESSVDTFTQPLQDYFVVQGTATSSPIALTENYSNYPTNREPDPNHPTNREPDPNHPTNREPDPKRQIELIKIPCPVTDEKDSSSVDEDNVILDAQMEEINSPNTTVLSDSIDALSHMNISNFNYYHIPTTERNSSLLQGNADKPKSDYVTSTVMPNELNSLQVSPYSLQTNLETGYSSLAGTSLSETNQVPIQPSSVTPQFCPIQPKIQTNNQILNRPLGYVDSKQTPGISSTAQSSCNSKSIELRHVPSNTTPNNSDVNGYLPHLSNVRQGSIFSNSAKEYVFPSSGASASEGYVPNSSAVQNPVSMSNTSESENSLPLQNNESIPNTSAQDTLGYVSSQDLPTTSLSHSDRDRDMESNYILSSWDTTENQSTGNTHDTSNGYVVQSQLSLPLSSAVGSAIDRQNLPVEGCQGYVDETFAKNSQREFEQTACIPETSKQTDGFGTGELANEYVAHQLLSQRLNNDQLHSNSREPLTVEMNNVSNQESIEERKKELQNSERDSDSGLSSLEQVSPEMERRQSDTKNDYVSCTFAESLQL